MAEDHAYHALHFEKSSNMEENEEKPCSTIISIPEKFNLEDLISEVLNDSADPSGFLLRKIKGRFLENHKMAYFGKSLLLFSIKKGSLFGELI